ncbi:MAG: hypothetical protein WC718_00075 [Phycisphaerales bacterium]|jgi:hypothetical protein
MSDSPTPPDPAADAPDPVLREMGQAEQVSVFRGELETLITRYASEFDLLPETILGVLATTQYTLLAETTMCFLNIGDDPYWEGSESDDAEGISRVEDDDNEGEEWRDDS